MVRLVCFVLIALAAVLACDSPEQEPQGRAPELLAAEIVPGYRCKSSAELQAAFESALPGETIFLTRPDTVYILRVPNYLDLRNSIIASKPGTELRAWSTVFHNYGSTCRVLEDGVEIRNIYYFHDFQVYANNVIFDDCKTLGPPTPTTPDGWTWRDACWIWIEDGYGGTEVWNTEDPWISMNWNTKFSDDVATVYYPRTGWRGQRYWWQPPDDIVKIVNQSEQTGRNFNPANR